MTNDFQARLDAIAANQLTDACTIFLRRHDGVLEPHTRFGAASAPEVAAVEAALANARFERYFPSRKISPGGPCSRFRWRRFGVHSAPS